MNALDTKHLKDEEFYTFVKFRDLLLRHGHFSLNDISLDKNVENIYNRICNAYSEWLEDLPVRITKGQTFDDNLEELREKAKDDIMHNEAEHLSILDKIEKTEWITFGELGVISWIWYEVYELAEFQTPEYKLSDEQKQELTTKISSYLELFRNDELKTGKINFYRFDLQKKMLINWVEENKMVSKYGTNFVISVEADYDGSIKGHHEFSIVQTAYALEEMDYLTVNEVWFAREYFGNDHEKSKYFLYLNVDLKEQFLKELNKDYQKKNPTITIESYDNNSGLLKFAGKEVFFIKGSKKTDAARLMETLLSADVEEWLERGEVFADWGMTKDDREQAAKNKIYFAKNAINDAVAKVTSVDDFVEGATKRFRINPRYRKTKVDE